MMGDELTKGEGLVLLSSIVVAGFALMALFGWWLDHLKKRHKGETHQKNGAISK